MGYDEDHNYDKKRRDGGMGEMSDDYDAGIRWADVRHNLPGAVVRVTPSRAAQSLIESTIGERAPRRERLRDRLKRERDELEAALAAVAQRMARRDEQLAHLARFPDEDPFEDGVILHFEKTFPGSDRSYSYVTHRVNGLYYLTGARSPQGVVWVELVDFMGLGVDEVYRVGVRGGRRKVIG